MGRIVKVKNTGPKETWLGWAIASGTYFRIPPLALETWEEDSHIYGSIVSGTLVVNDGTSDFADPAEGWDWLVGNNVDAIVVSGSLTCTGTINLVGADGANVSAVGDTITIHGGGNSTLRTRHAYAIPGEIKVASGETDFIIPFFVSLAAGQSAKLVKARHKINVGTSVTCKIQKNDVDVTGFTGISVTTTAANTDPADIALADDDKLALVVTAVAGTPQNMSFDVFLELTG